MTVNIEKLNVNLQYQNSISQQQSRELEQHLARLLQQCLETTPLSQDFVAWHQKGGSLELPDISLASFLQAPENYFDNHIKPVIHQQLPIEPAESSEHSSMKFNHEETPGQFSETSANEADILANPVFNPTDIGELTLREWVEGLTRWLSLPGASFYPMASDDSSVSEVEVGHHNTPQKLHWQATALTVLFRPENARRVIKILRDSWSEEPTQKLAAEVFPEHIRSCLDNAKNQGTLSEDLVWQFVSRRYHLQGAFPERELCELFIALISHLNMTQTNSSFNITVPQWQSLVEAFVRLSVNVSHPDFFRFEQEYSGSNPEHAGKGFWYREFSRWMMINSQQMLGEKELQQLLVMASIAGAKPAYDVPDSVSESVENANEQKGVFDSSLTDDNGSDEKTLFNQSSTNKSSPNQSSSNQSLYNQSSFREYLPDNGHSTETEYPKNSTSDGNQPFSSSSTDNQLSETKKRLKEQLKQLQTLLAFLLGCASANPSHLHQSTASDAEPFVPQSIIQKLVFQWPEIANKLSPDLMFLVATPVEQKWVLNRIVEQINAWYVVASSHDASSTEVNAGGLPDKLLFCAYLQKLCHITTLPAALVFEISAFHQQVFKAKDYLPVAVVEALNKLLRAFVSAMTVENNVGSPIYQRHQIATSDFHIHDVHVRELNESDSHIGKINVTGQNDAEQALQQALIFLPQNSQSLFSIEDQLRFCQNILIAFSVMPCQLSETVLRWMLQPEAIDKLDTMLRAFERHGMLLLEQPVTDIDPFGNNNVSAQNQSDEVSQTRGGRTLPVEFLSMMAGNGLKSFADTLNKIDRYIVQFGERNNVHQLSVDGNHPTTNKSFSGISISGALSANNDHPFKLSPITLTISPLEIQQQLSGISMSLELLLQKLLTHHVGSYLNKSGDSGHRNTVATQSDVDINELEKLKVEITSLQHKVHHLKRRFFSLLPENTRERLFMQTWWLEMASPELADQDASSQESLQNGFSKNGGVKESQPTKMLSKGQKMAFKTDSKQSLLNQSFISSQQLFSHQNKNLMVKLEECKRQNLNITQEASNLELVRQALRTLNLLLKVYQVYVHQDVVGKGGLAPKSSHHTLSVPNVVDAEQSSRVLLLATSCFHHLIAGLNKHPQTLAASIINSLSPMQDWVKENESKFDVNFDYQAFSKLWKTSVLAICDLPVDASTKSLLPGHLVLDVFEAGSLPNSHQKIVPTFQSEMGNPIERFSETLQQASEGWVKLKQSTLEMLRQEELQPVINSLHTQLQSLEMLGENSQVLDNQLKNSQLKNSQLKNSQLKNSQLKNSQLNKGSATQEFLSEVAWDAGIFLYWPLLKRFFIQQQLLDEQYQWRNLQAQKLAVRLLTLVLQIDADAHSIPPICCNLLLGLSPSDPVEAGIEISSGHQQACINLTEILISQWPALNNMPVEGFNELFSKRECTFAKTELGYNFEVQHRPQDALLIKLPWGLGIITLPWLNKTLLDVRWKTGF